MKDVIDFYCYGHGNIILTDSDIEQIIYPTVEYYRELAIAIRSEGK